MSDNRDTKMEADTEDLTTCQICCEEYHLTERIPRFLPCTHTVCEMCIARILSMENKDIFDCPECRKGHPLDANKGISSFHQNKYILAHLRRLQRTSQDDCRIHTRPFSLYCEEDGCRTVICTKCLVESHNGHTTSDLIEKAQTTKQHFGSEISHMMDTLVNCKTKGQQVAANQFQRCHEILQRLQERRILLSEVVNRYIQNLEDETFEHYKTQTQSICDQQRKLAEGLKELASHSTQMNEMTNSNVLTNLEANRQRCQELVHDVVKGAGLSGTCVNLLTFHSNMEDERTERNKTRNNEEILVQELVGKLILSESSVETLTESPHSGCPETNESCDCRICKDGKIVENLNVTKPVQVETAGVDEMGDVLGVQENATDGVAFAHDVYVEELSGAVGGLEAAEQKCTLQDGMKVALDATGTGAMCSYPDAIYAPKWEVDCVTPADKFADLCPEPPAGYSGSVIHSKVLRLVALPNGLLKSFGDYGMFNIQSKIFSDDQYNKAEYWYKVSWKKPQDVHCEEEVTIQGENYQAVVEHCPKGTHCICFNSEGGGRYVIDLPGQSVQYMCLLAPAGIVYAYTQCSGEDLANMVFYRIGFIDYHPEPALKAQDFTTDFISLAAMCAMTHAPEPLLVLCGLRIDISHPGSSWIAAYTTSGQALWRFNGSAAVINDKPLDPHAVCTDGWGNLFVAVRGSVLLFDANGNFKKQLIKRLLGQEANMSLAYRPEKKQLVVSHVCKARDAGTVKGAKPIYDPLSVLNFYNVQYVAQFAPPDQ